MEASLPNLLRPPCCRRPLLPNKFKECAVKPNEQLEIITLKRLNSLLFITIFIRACVAIESLLLGLSFLFAAALEKILAPNPLPTFKVGVVRKLHAGFQKRRPSTNRGVRERLRRGWRGWGGGHKDSWDTTAHEAQSTRAYRDRPSLRRRWTFFFLAFVVRRPATTAHPAGLPLARQPGLPAGCNPAN